MFLAVVLQATPESTNKRVIEVLTSLPTKQNPVTVEFNRPSFSSDGYIPRIYDYYKRRKHLFYW